MTEEHVIDLADLDSGKTDILAVPMDKRGGVLYIGSLGSEEYLDWLDARNEAKTADERRNAAALLVVKSLVKGPKDATRTGTEAMVAVIRKSRTAPYNRLIKAIFKLNGINQPEEEAAKNA